MCHPSPVTYELSPDALRWDEVDPRRIPFDAERAADVIAGLGPAASVPVRPAGHAGDPEVIRWSHETGRRWTEEMTEALAAHYGRWALGWRWAYGEGDIGGGPGSGWCCPRDSITVPAETLARVAAALVGWRGWLEELAGHFDRFPVGDESEPERRLLWERGAAHLVTLVAGRTGAADAWYEHCHQVLTWFLARWNVPEFVAEGRVFEAVGGRFESWIEPSPATVKKVSERLADSLGDELLLPGSPGEE